MAHDQRVSLGRNCPHFVTLYLTGQLRSLTHFTVVAASSGKLIYEVSHGMNSSSSPEHDLIARVEITASKANLELLCSALQCP